jgi:hypothetical protein
MKYGQQSQGSFKDVDGIRLEVISNGILALAVLPYIHTCDFTKENECL